MEEPTRGSMRARLRGRQRALLGRSPSVLAGIYGLQLGLVQLGLVQLYSLQLDLVQLGLVQLGLVQLGPDDG